MEPFRIDVPQAKLDRIAAKLALCEIGYAPADDAERAFNVADWQRMAAGGHFAALEEPVAFAANVGSFFAQLSQG